MLATVGILYLVFHDPAKRAEMAQALRQANRWWLLAGFVVYGLVEFLSGIRWQLLLRVQGIVLSWTRLFHLVLMGVAFNFLIPGGTGGDVVKVYFLLKETPGQRTRALLSVLVDRLIGLVALIAIAGVIIAAQWPWLHSSPAAVKYIWVTLAILGSLLAGLGLSFLLTGLGLIHKLPARLPGRDKLASFALAYNLYGRAWQPTAAAFVLSVVAHFGHFALFFCAASAFGATSYVPTFGEFCSIMPIVDTLTSIPISLGGLGVRENLFQIFLGDLCGVSPAVAALMATTGYALVLGWGLLGGVLYFFYRPSEHTRLREMRAEVASLEHAVAEEEIALETAEEEKR